jgi:hypothetical protein
MSGLTRRAYRLGMWGLVALGSPGLFAAFLGARRIIPLPLGVAGGFTFFACVLLGALVGLQARREMQLQRDRESYSTMLVILATQLRVQYEPWQRIAGRGGPVGEAAKMVLEEGGEGERERERERESFPGSTALADELADSPPCPRLPPVSRACASTSTSPARSP